ncbi:MAG: DUF4384 domain-containing protein [Rhodospirillales bacterium]|jgi:hypothetical protein|nr:DUF4384 domain-containing protein [Rhodospirillales bacterium]
MRMSRGVGAIFAAALMVSTAAMAQPFETAIDKAGDNLAASMARQGWGEESTIGIARFMGSAGVACEPMSSILTEGLRRALIRHTERMAVKAKVAENLDPRVVRAVVSGQWYRGAQGTARLTVKLGDVTDMKFTDMAMEEVRFETASLPPEARRCVLELEPIEREVIADRAIIAREAPSSVGKMIARLEAGATMWVSARVLSEGAEDWFVVRLDDDDNMPVGMRERRAFAYRITLPDDVLKRFRVTEAEAVLSSDKSVIVRAEPTVKAQELGRLSAGSVVVATGTVIDRDWYRIDWRSDDAYVYAPLMKTVDVTEAAQWSAVRQSKKRADVKAFLDKWPRGDFARHAKQRLADLGPPPLKVTVWTESKAYRSGETIKVFVKGNKDFFARVVYRDVGGNLVQLLPNAYRETNRFAGGTTHAIPSDTDRFDLEVGGPFGEETIMVFASTTPIGEINGEDIGGGLSLLRGSLDDIRRTTRGVGVRPRQPGDVKQEFFEATARLTTRP